MHCSLVYKKQVSHSHITYILSAVGAVYAAAALQTTLMYKKVLRIINLVIFLYIY